MRGKYSVGLVGGLWLLNCNGVVGVCLFFIWLLKRFVRFCKSSRLRCWSIWCCIFVWLLGVSVRSFRLCWVSVSLRMICVNCLLICCLFVWMRVLIGGLCVKCWRMLIRLFWISFSMFMLMGLFLREKFWSGLFRW